MLNLYTFFHLNLAYSSIEEEKRIEVIEKCYWPLLRLAEKTKLPIGIELTGYSLEQVLDIAPGWVQKLKELISSELVEFIGSGYAQVIGPLVPAKVNEANLRLGLKTYEQILSLEPQIALINEQAFSAGLISLYKQAGYKAIIMEWNNPATNHPEWQTEWAYYPQLACDNHGCEIPVIWNHSVAFQKFQRYAHGEMQLAEQLNFLEAQNTGDERVFSLYGNDAEIFDFRPGRFHTESVLGKESEWERLERLVEAIKEDETFRFVLPNEVLAPGGQTDSFNRIELQSTQQPVPVKKQNKYNIARWAVTGIDDLDINTRCWQIYESLVNAHDTAEDSWRELCYLWSSDFRTHITHKRWHEYQNRLKKFEQKYSCFEEKVFSIRGSKETNDWVIKQGERFLFVENQYLKVELDCYKGLALRKLWFDDFSGEHQLGTLPHGYFEDITFAADFYSGHFTFEMPGRPKVTDLEKVKASIERYPGWLEVKCKIKTGFYPFTKILRIYSDRPEIGWEYNFDWPALPVGSMRFGHFTLNPKAAQPQDLFFQTHNGGKKAEHFQVNNIPVEHGKAVSALVSVSNALGLTEGQVTFGCKKNRLKLSVEKSNASLIGLITHHPISSSYLFRVSLSAREIDETNHLDKSPILPFSKNIQFSISPKR